MGFMKQITSPIEPLASEPGLAMPKLAVVGGLLGGLAASSCCILPLALFGAGVSGAWIGKLTQLAPYQPYFIAFALGCISYGAWRVHQARQVACAPATACARPLNTRIVSTGLVASALIVGAALLFDFVAPFILGS